MVNVGAIDERLREIGGRGDREELLAAVEVPICLLERTWPERPIADFARHGADGIAVLLVGDMEGEGRKRWIGEVGDEEEEHP